MKYPNPKSRQEQKVDIEMAKKTYEDALQRITGEPMFDAWLDEIPDNVSDGNYLTALKWMYESLAKHRKPTKAQIKMAFTTTRINLNFNPAMGGKDQGRGYFIA